jgi:hypothetical protein
MFMHSNERSHRLTFEQYNYLDGLGWPSDKLTSQAPLSDHAR